MFLRLSLLLILVVGCQSQPKTSTPVVQKVIPLPTEMQKVQDEFFVELWTLNPDWASSLGLRRYDAELVVPDKAHWERMRSFYRKYQARLGALKTTGWDSSVRMDVDLLLNFCRQGLWELNTFKSYEWNPSVYNVGTALASVLEANNIPEEQKWSSLMSRLQKVPAYYEAAIQNVRQPTKEHLELAIQQNQGLESFLQNNVLSSLKKSKLTPEQQMVFQEHFKAAVGAIQTYGEKLKETQSRIKKFRSFRIGPQLYAEKFRFEIQSERSPKDIYKQALAIQKTTHHEMWNRALELWPKYYPNEKPPKDRMKVVRLVLEKVSQQHVKAADFFKAIEKDIPELWSFIEKKDLLSLDKKKPLKVRPTPEYQRGFAGASVDAPGPFDADRETYYNVTPLDRMSPERQASYLREYNNHTLHILNIHEALPGHYAQLVYSNKSPSLVKKIFGNGAMIEGWAVYAERMMMEEGYGQNNPELWLMYSKWRLRVLANTILDYSIHHLNMDKKQAMNLMVEKSFQETAEAEEKWTRATLSQVQLASYFTGYTEIYSLREEMRLKMQGRFRLKKFHEDFLSHGSVPVKMIRQEMVKGVKQ